MQSLHVEMNAQSVSNSSFSMEQIQNQAVSLQSSEVYFSMNIKYAVVISMESTWKNNSEIHCGNSVHLWGHGSVNTQAWPTCIYPSC